MRVYIWAVEGIYQGLHGIESTEVHEVNTIEEANEIARLNAYELVESFGLEEEYEEYGDDGFEPEYMWNIYKIREEFNNISTRELDELCCRLGDELFREEYCGEELFG